MWKELITKISKDYRFNDRATEQEISELEETFDLELPMELRSLLEETDGINYESGGYLIWPTTNILAENSDLRTDEIFAEYNMPFDSLIFFADAGNGDFFGYKINADGEIPGDVFVWKHEDDSRICIASSLKEFIIGWTDGTIGV